MLGIFMFHIAFLFIALIFSILIICLDTKYKREEVEETMSTTLKRLFSLQNIMDNAEEKEKNNHVLSSSQSLTLQRRKTMTKQNSQLTTQEVVLIQVQGFMDSLREKKKTQVASTNSNTSLNLNKNLNNKRITAKEDKCLENGIEQNC